MSGTRNTRTRLVGATAAVVLAALSMTACDGGTAVHDEGASAGATANASSSTGASASQTPATGTSSSASAGTSGSAGMEPVASTTATKRPPSSGKPVTCEGSTTKTVAAPVNRPVNHMLLTVTNTGSVPCHLYSYPAVRFGEAQAVPPVIAESRPQAVVTLAPGESGYAAVLLAAADGSGSDGRTEKSLTVHFRGRSGNESVGASAAPSLPAGGVHIDDSLEVTYWQQSMDDALTW